MRHWLRPRARVWALDSRVSEAQGLAWYLGRGVRV